MNILNQLADHARERVKTAEKMYPFDEIKERALSLPKGDFAFEKALAKPGIRFICECKKASPSKGLIAPEFPYLEIARSYEKAGADAVSVLTEPKWFLGDDRYLKEIASEVSIPCLRKDFTVDKYMIYEAKLLGAATVLLICSILSAEELAEYLRICDELGISALVETHDAAEVSMALSAGARIIGVNNRNLKDFSVDTENSRSEKTAGCAMTTTKIKFCGLSRNCDIETANALSPDYVGFVFVKNSRRCVSFAQAKELKALLAPGILTVGVFVNEDPRTVAALLEAGVIDAAQLHGDEDTDYIRGLKSLTKAPLIKAFGLRSIHDLPAVEHCPADLVLLDSPGGGTGRLFDWQLLENIQRPYFLSGGLSAENVGEAIARLRPFGVDVSSGIETGGYKDREKMTAFAAAVREEK